MLFLGTRGKTLECFSLHPPFPHSRSGFLAPGISSTESLPRACRGAAQAGLMPAGAEGTPRARSNSRSYKNTDRGATDSVVPTVLRASEMNGS